MTEEEKVAEAANDSGGEDEDEEVTDLTNR